jgi:hypothetical protein
MAAECVCPPRLWLVNLETAACEGLRFIAAGLSRVFFEHRTNHLPWLFAATPGPQPDRRATLREQMDRHGVTITLFVIRRDGAYTKHKIEPHDFSKQGMGFDHSETLVVGSHCEFEITFKGQKMHVIGKVLRCEEREPGRFNIAVLFDQVLPGNAV